MAKNLVIVESPAKAKTINRYLGKDFVVKASMGHVRDLPKSKLGVDVDNDFQPSYVSLRDKSSVIKELRAAAKKSETIYLAADPDREGESICFHVRELLKKEGKAFKRVTFNEITKQAILNAFEHAGDMNMSKIEAQQARRILDRLVGYNLSPLLWKKVGRGLSAGRVQSVALKLIVEREKEIKAFISEEYWKIAADLKGKSDSPFEAVLNKHKGKKASITNGEQAEELRKYIEEQEFLVSSLKTKKRKRNSPLPFITSTLQQEAFRKLGFSVSRTMRLAQQLYEGIQLGSEGQVALITYMRTDSTRISDEAKSSAYGFIKDNFGEKFLGFKKAPKKDSGNVQDAHEAVRPNYVNRTPESLRGVLENDLFRLYDLIWKRFIASQMSPAEFEATTVEIDAGDCSFKATGNRLIFKGYLEVMGKTDEKEDQDALLPKIEEGEVLDLIELRPTQHFTQPPARFNEAALVKELEAQGIGRPSTYSTIISTIINREYVDRIEKRLHPTELGMIVTDLLSENFHDLMDYDYTARMEQVLDRIEDGNENWVAALQRFHKGFASDLQVAEEKMRNLKEEIQELDEKCPDCESNLIVRWGRFGKFKACSQYPTCKYSSPLEETESESAIDSTRSLGLEPESGKEILLKKGPYGFYLQLGSQENGKKPKRVPLPRGVRPEKVTEEFAKQLLSLPITLGNDPETEETVKLGLGRFGPYVQRGKTYVSVKKVDELFTISLDEAVKRINSAPKKGPIKEFPAEGKQKEIKVMRGRFGPYITDGSVNAPVPKDEDPEAITLEKALEILASKGKKKKGRKTARKKKSS
jgi:DNA topoisomerase-1